MPTPTETAIAAFPLARALVSASGRMVAAYTQGADVTNQHQAVSHYSWKIFGRPLGAYYQDGPGHERLLDGPSMRDLLEDIQAGEIGVLIVDSIDRISCVSVELERFARLCRQMDVQVLTPATGPSQNFPLTPSVMRVAGGATATIVAV